MLMAAVWNALLIAGVPNKWPNGRMAECSQTKQPDTEQIARRKQTSQVQMARYRTARRGRPESQARRAAQNGSQSARSGARVAQSGPCSTSC